MTGRTLVRSAARGDRRYFPLSRVLKKARTSAAAGAVRAGAWWFGGSDGSVTQALRATMQTVTEPILRKAGVGDARAIALVHIASSDDVYAPLAGEWRAVDPDERAARWARSLGEENRLALVAEGADGTVIGFVSGGPARRQESDAEFEIYAIHVCPWHRGRGVGGAMWNAACRDLRGSRLAAMYVDTLAELRACSFYERHGGKVAERGVTTFHGAQRTHLTYRWASGLRSDSM
jgi:ribosomal protein S18 acetylase RimI-like enzyme